MRLMLGYVFIAIYWTQCISFSLLTPCLLNRMHCHTNFIAISQYSANRQMLMRQCIRYNTHGVGMPYNMHSQTFHANYFAKSTKLSMVENSNSLINCLSSDSTEQSDSSEVNFSDDFTMCTSSSGKFITSEMAEVNNDLYNPKPQSSSIHTTFQKTWSKILDKVILMRTLVSIESNATGVGILCDMINESNDGFDSWCIRKKRYHVLSTMLAQNREDYIKTVNFFGDRIPRHDLPNVQNIPISTLIKSNTDPCDSHPISFLTIPLNFFSKYASNLDSEKVTFSNKQSSGPDITGVPALVEDCLLENVTFSESRLDAYLLKKFRGIVKKEIGWESSSPGIIGLLEEARHVMLSDSGSPERQTEFVMNSLTTLLPSILPPLYRIFMSGIVPSEERGDPKWILSIVSIIRRIVPSFIKTEIYPGKQFGPLPYAPYLSSLVTPTFLAFLVGPSRANRRKDGKLGGMVIEKCKFLQESGCKGICLHQCKLPAEKYFSEVLGLPLSVTPDFTTQECQWSWGEVPVPASIDPNFPAGCLKGCPTRQELKARAKSTRKANMCST